MAISKILIISLLLLGINSTYAQTAAKVNIIQDERIPELLELKTKMTKENEFNDRYKIQILNYGDLSEANSVLEKYKTKFWRWQAKITYQTPNYKVWVGNYRNKLQADRALLEITKVFPNAFVFEPDN